ncbi:MAG: ribosome biogenesis GTPase Der [Oligoflexia bacterium]|nr:ribosome biogenesis GTPase Der [Oligoflexia bacterium]
MKVLIVGRTNVGKSSLFNRLVKKNSSLVINESGITRDLLKDKAHWWGHDFEVIDSGGLPSSRQKDALSLKILEKINLALKTADIFIVVVSAKESLQPEDFDLLKKARKINKPFLLFVNKVDNPQKTDILTAPFFELNPKLLSGSVENNYGVDEIVEWIISQKQRLKLDLKSKAPEHTKLFVTGRANSGKSLLCNQILGSNRMIVSSKSGTTLDTVTESFSYNKKGYVISDNPGSRRGNREEREKISYAKSRSELETADIVLLVLDALLKPGRQETRLTQTCLEEHKPVILVVNKMDLLKKYSSEEKKEIQQEIKKTFHFYPDLPIVYMSAKTAYHKDKLFKTIEELKRKISFKVSTSELNRFFSKVIRKAPAPVYGVSDVKFYYINQTNKKPPEFIAFANYPKGVTASYKRFIINKIKKEWNLKGIPIAFHALPKR